MLNATEMVLANRVRSTFPARLADRLPNDEQLVEMIRTVERNLTNDVAFAWVSMAFIKAIDEMEGIEEKLMRSRAKALFGRDL